MNALAGFIFNIIGFINYVLVPLIFAIAFLVFIWGVVQYFIIGGAEGETRQKGRSFIMWGLIGFVVMISLWGLVNMLVNTLGFNNYARPALPTFGSPSQSGSFGGYGNGGNRGSTISTNACGAFGYCDGFGSQRCVAGQCVSSGSGSEFPTNGGGSGSGFPE